MRVLLMILLILGLILLLFYVKKNVNKFSSNMPGNILLTISFLIINKAIEHFYLNIHELIGNITLLFWSTSIYFGALFLLAVLLELYEKTNFYIRRKINKSKNGEKIELIFWLSESNISGNFLFKLFKEETEDRHNDITNVLKIKEILKKSLGNDILNYKLFKNHLEFRVKDNFIQKTSMVIVSGIISAIVASIVTNFEKFSEKFSGLFEGVESYNKISDFLLFLISIEGLSLIIVLIITLFCIYILLKLFYLILTEQKRTIKYLILVLETIIEDMES